MSNTIYFVEGVSCEQALEILKTVPDSSRHKFDRVICYREGRKVIYICEDIYRPQCEESLETLRAMYGSEIEYVNLSSDKTLIAFLI